MAVRADVGLTETLGLYSPSMGPPTWWADGSGTAPTLEVFEVQQQVYRDWLKTSGLVVESAPGVLTNAYRYAPSDPTPAQRVAEAVAATPAPIVNYAGQVQQPTNATKPEAPKPEAPKPTDSMRGALDATPAARPPAPECPAGMSPVFQTSSNRWTCLQGGIPDRPIIAAQQPGVPNVASPQSFAFRTNAGSGIGASQLDWGGVVSTVGNVGCNLITNAQARAACLALAAGVGGALGATDTRGSGLSAIPLSSSPPLTSCPQGMVWDGRSCVNQGIMGTIERALPGDVGRPDRVFQSVAGGMGGVAPIQYSTVRRVCPPRYALGLDNVCYPKPMLPRGFRKWVPARKPLLTGGEVRVLQRAKGLQKRVRKLAGKVAPKAKSCSCAKKGAKK